MRNLGRAKRMILFCGRRAVFCSSGRVAADDWEPEKKKGGKKPTPKMKSYRGMSSKQGHSYVRGAALLTKYGIVRVGARSSKARSRGECFEALAARRRSLFSADNKAARCTDGVPDSRAKHAGLELIWGMFQCFGTVPACLWFR
ncbi:hypothetical protein V8C34DRAFT_279650 [Trichoderma compactum]